MRLLPYFLLAMLVCPAYAAQPKIAEPAIPESSGITASEHSSDLLALYHESRLEDPRILAAYARTQASQEYSREAFGRLLPQISVNSGANRIKQVNDLSNQIYNNENYSIGISQVIYNKSAWENYQKYKYVAKQSLSEAEVAQAEATVDLAQRYFLALAADDELGLIIAERGATQKNLDRISALYEKGYAKVTDVLDLKARVDALAAQEVEARNQVRLSRAALSEIVGRPVMEKLSRVRNDVELKVSDESLDSWVQLALTENPSIKANLNAVEAAEAGLREGKGGHYPSVNLNLSAQNTNEGYNNSLAPKTDSYVAGITLSIPIYSGGSTSARVRGLYQDRIAAEQQLEFARRQVLKETTNAYLTADSSVEKIRANRNALVSAEQSSIASEKAFTYGVVNAVDVLTSVQNEYRARRDLLKTQYDFITNLFILNRWAGKLSTDSVESVNVWLSNNSKTESAQDRKSMK